MTGVTDSKLKMGSVLKQDRVDSNVSHEQWVRRKEHEMKLKE
jgi:hypothetical protein